MYKNHSKIISVILALALALSMYCLPVSAEYTTTIHTTSGVMQANIGDEARVDFWFTYTQVPYGAPSIGEPTDTNWYVSGVGELCNGIAWYPCAPENKMTFNEETGLYEIVFSQVGEGASESYPFSFDFKVTDGTWDESYPVDNVRGSISAKDDVKVTFNPETKEVNWYSSSKFIITDFTYRVAGDASLCGSSWNATDDDNKMTYNEETSRYEKVYTGVSACEQGYMYKITVDGSTWIPEGFVNPVVYVQYDNATVTIWYDEATGLLGAEVEYENRTFNVSLDANGGTINSGNITGYTYGQGATLPTDVTKAGYTFMGWYDNQALTGSPVTAISETETGEKKYWAKWEAKTFNVSLDANGGTINSGNITGYTYGQGATLPTDVTKAGYTFMGWYDNQALTGSPVTAISETETGEKKYWAKWEAKTYTVSFNTGGGNTINDKTVTWEDKVLEGISSPTKSGWAFTGWTCGNTAVTSYTTYGDLAENDTAAGITLTAQWRDTSIPTGGGSVSSNQHTCKDVSPKDHKCDICGATLSNHSGGTATCTEKAICEICGKPYGETDSTNHNLKKIPEKEATADETGNEEYWHCEDCDKDFSDKNGKNPVKPEDMIISKLPPEIIEGAGQSVTKGERKTLTFRSNAAFGDFIRVELDGKTLDESNYTVKEGSTVVTLKADFVATLSVGKHTLAIVSESGTATAEFTVYATAEEAEEAEEIEEVEEIEDDDICPPTGYDGNMPLLLTLMFVSGGTVFAAAVIGRKKKQSKN